MEVDLIEWQHSYHIGGMGSYFQEHLGRVGSDRHMAKWVALNWKAWAAYLDEKGFSSGGLMIQSRRSYLENSKASAAADSVARPLDVQETWGSGVERGSGSEPCAQAMASSISRCAPTLCG